MSDEDLEFLRQLDEEIAIMKQQETVSTARQTAESIQNAQPSVVAASPPNLFQNQSSQEMSQWGDTWGNLNLTPEEEDRLRRGFAAMMQRWQSMTPEQQQAEMQRFQEGMQRWQAMSEEERMFAEERMRERFQEWRESGAELTEFSFY